MRRTNCEDTSRRIAVNTEELKSMLGCGRDTAVKIGTEAKARVQIGKRVLWNVEKIQTYLNILSEGGSDERQTIQGQENQTSEEILKNESEEDPEEQGEA